MSQLTTCRIFSTELLLIPDEEDYENRYKYANERDEDLTTNYTTATMSGDAEAAFAAELEDTAADVSNIDALDQADDQVMPKKLCSIFFFLIT